VSEKGRGGGGGGGKETDLTIKSSSAEDDFSRGDFSTASVSDYSRHTVYAL